MRISTTLAAVIGFAALAACNGGGEDNAANADNAMMTDMNAGMDMNMTDMNAGMDMNMTDMNAGTDMNTTGNTTGTTGNTTDTNTAGNTL